MSKNYEEFHKQTKMQLNGVTYDIEVAIDGDILIIFVENCESYEQWTGKYDSSYIEELSHKTGNFKQFHIFCNMLESAILKNTQSVSLDLLTYEDLKILRERKLNSKTTTTSLSHARKKHTQTGDPNLQLKRYLIMTYTVEFDQIHYPLPLTYTGMTDATSLKKRVKELKYENTQLRKNHGKSASSLAEETINCGEYEKIIEENNELKEELRACTKELQDRPSTGNFSKELNVLKKLVQNLETDLVKEKSKHQRAMMKKKKEYDELLRQFEELKSSERSYRIRCKSLTDELSIIKKRSRLSPVVKTRNNVNNRSSSRERTQQRSSFDRGRTFSTQHRHQSSRSVSRDRERSMSAGSSYGRRTPSPGGFRRFDPSAYIKEKEERRKENENSKSRKRTPSSTSRRVLTPRSNSHLSKPPLRGSKGQNHSKPRSNTRHRFNSERRLSNNSEDSTSRLKTRTISSNSAKQKRRNSEDEYYNNDPPRSKVNSVKKLMRNNPLVRNYELNTGDEDEDRSVGIADIDARLQALKDFMSNNMD